MKNMFLYFNFYLFKLQVITLKIIENLFVKIIENLCVLAVKAADRRHEETSDQYCL